MTLPVLPAKYYLTHFFEMIEFIETQDRLLLEDSHRDFLKDFRSLSESAQCAYVRMVNRKGFLFRREDFLKYREIENSETALHELECCGFAGRVRSNDLLELAKALTKSQLEKWLKLQGLRDLKRATKKSELIDLVINERATLDLATLPDVSNWLSQERRSEMDYLLFLYFGRRQASLNLYTLRDLGVRQAAQAKTQYKPRFRRLEEAKVAYELACMADEIEHLTSIEEMAMFAERLRDLSGLSSSAIEQRSELMLLIAKQAEDLDVDFAMKLLSEIPQHPARERLVRNLMKLGREIEAKEWLEKILQSPFEDEELLFAEDFMARKFGDKRIGFMTEVLRSSREILLPESSYKQPEQGVLEYYRSQGLTAEHAENDLWLELFGTLFWDELFESEESAIFNPFERLPQDLVGEDFYRTHQIPIERKLESLRDLNQTEKTLLKCVGTRYGKLNDIFRWHPRILDRSLTFLRWSREKDVAHVLRTMASSFSGNHSGFPDLVVCKNGEAAFIEVKAEGDSLRSKQVSKMRLLRDSGFEVEVLRVKWKTDPNQVYVVVDVETTGGMASFHRVTEIGAVKVQGGRVIDEFQTLLNPERAIPASITRITGITNEMVADAPLFRDVAQRFADFTKGAIFVAHNARFDYGFIQREFERIGERFVRPLMCTVVESRKVFPGISSYSLKNLTEHFSISLDQHHRAMCDARATAVLLGKIHERRDEPS